MVGLWGSICSLSPPSSPSSHNEQQQQQHPTRPLLWTNSLPRKNRRQPGEWNFYEKTESCYDLTTLDFGYRQQTKATKATNNNLLLTKSQSGSVLKQNPRAEDDDRKGASLVRTQSGLIVPPRRKSKSRGKESTENKKNTERVWEVVQTAKECCHDQGHRSPFHSQNNRTMVCGELVRSQSGLLVPPRGRKVARQEGRMDFNNMVVAANKEKKENSVGSSALLKQERQRTTEESRHKQDVMRREERQEEQKELNRKAGEGGKLVKSNSKLSIDGRRGTPKRFAPSPPLNPTITSDTSTTSTTTSTTKEVKVPPAPPPRKKSLQAASYSKVWAKSSATANISEMAMNNNIITISDPTVAPTNDSVDAFWKLINSNMALNYFMTDGLDEAKMSSKMLHNVNKEGNRDVNKEGFNDDDVSQRRTESSDSASPPPLLKNEIWRTPRESWILTTTSPSCQKTLISTNGDLPEVWKTPRQSWMTTSDGYIDCCEEFRDCWKTKRQEDEEYAKVEKQGQVRVGETHMQEKYQAGQIVLLREQLLANVHPCILTFVKMSHTIVQMFLCKNYETPKVYYR